MLTAAIAVGACVTWGNPIGCVLLSIELTASHFMVGTLLKCFIATTFGIITMNLLYALPH